MDKQGPTHPTGTRTTRLFRRAGTTAVRLICILVWLWCLGAVWYAETPTGLLRIVVTVAFAAGFPLAWLFTKRRRTVTGVFALLAIVIIVSWQFKAPSRNRAWSPDVAVPVSADIHGDRVLIQNIRHCAYRTAEDFDVAYRDQEIDLTTLRSVDFVVVPFGDFFGIAHTLLSFGFEDGTYLAVSAEIRRERDEHYHPLPGLYKQYELAYVIGDERDLIRVRTDFRAQTVYLYPIIVSPEDLRALFVDMLTRANQLRANPEYYNTLANTCTTNIVRHIDRIAPDKIPLSYRVFLPGFSDALAYELGMIDTDLPFAEARERFRIDERARAIGDDPEFSTKIRQLTDP